ncbi:V-type proton ATPase subunit E [Balamuthia mandrillaris]
MNPEQVKKQLSNMESFILKEAQEKKEEIEAKAEEEFTIEKTRLVQAEKLKIRKEYERKEKQVVVQQKITYSNQLNQARLRVLSARDDVIKALQAKAQQALVELGRPGEKYKQLLQKLILQALLRLMEPQVSLRCRKEDEDMVKGVMGAAVQEYKQKTGKTCELSIDTKHYLPPAPQPGKENKHFCCGGVVLSSKGGKIMCDNTLDQRLMLAFEAKIPEIRKTVF